MFKKILVPIDVSQSDSGATGLKAAATLGGKSGAELVLLNITGPVPNLVAVQLPSNYMDSTHEGARKIMEELASAEGLKPGSYEIQTAQGVTYHEILSAAKSCGADLIAIASHQPDVSDYLLGSTAAKIVRHAEISVLVVRD